MVKESRVVRRVLNGPCAGGHGGQVTSEQISHGQKARRRFQSVNQPFCAEDLTSPTVH